MEGNGAAHVFWARVGQGRGRFVRHGLCSGDYKGSGWYRELLLLLLGADSWCTHQRPWWSWWAAFSFFRRRFRQGGFGCTCPREVDAPLSSDAAICTKLWRLGKNCCWMVYGSERDRLMKRMEKESRADCVVWD